MENLQKFLCSNVKLLNWKNIKPEFLNDNEEMFKNKLALINKNRDKRDPTAKFWL